MKYDIYKELYICVVSSKFACYPSLFYLAALSLILAPCNLLNAKSPDIPEAFHPPLDPHPPSGEEIQQEIEDNQYKYKREILDSLDPENAPHSTEDAKNFA